MGKINSKAKGSRFELTLAHYFEGKGFATRRTAQYCGNSGEAADVVGLPGIHIEAKHQEQMRLYDWMAQAVNDSEKSKRIPCVFHKKNRAEVLVTMRLDDWLSLYEEWLKNNLPFAE